MLSQQTSSHPCDTSLHLLFTFIAIFPHPTDTCESDMNNPTTTTAYIPYTPSFNTRCRESRVTAFIRSHVAGAYVKSESSQELHYILPFEAAKKGAFEKLFGAMDRSLDALEVSSYGVVDTSLEEVFLKVTESTINSPEEGKLLWH
jgi:ATP-binding cassette subfamily A (ABC1) protein 2